MDIHRKCGYFLHFFSTCGTKIFSSPIFLISLFEMYFLAAIGVTLDWGWGRMVAH